MDRDSRLSSASFHEMSSTRIAAYTWDIGTLVSISIRDQQSHFLLCKCKVSCVHARFFVSSSAFSCKVFSANLQEFSRALWSFARAITPLVPVVGWREPTPRSDAPKTPHQ